MIFIVFLYLFFTVVSSYKVILVGMPGTGKSYLAKRLSKFTGVPYYDTDTIILREDPECIDKGWKHFRQKEVDILSKVTKKETYVVSTGGGVVEHIENQKLLRSLKDVKIVLVQRSVPGEIKKTRKLESSWDELYSKRHVIYRNVSTHTYNNSRHVNYFISFMKQIE